MAESTTAVMAEEGEGPPGDTAEDAAARRALEVEWMLPGSRANAEAAVARIERLCGAFPDLHAALLAVLATHQQLPRPILASAVQRFRAELQAHSHDDVVALLVALWNGGRQGFDAVLRTRRSGGARPAVAVSAWVKD